MTDGGPSWTIRSLCLSLTNEKKTQDSGGYFSHYLAFSRIGGWYDRVFREFSFWKYNFLSSNGQNYLNKD